MKKWFLVGFSFFFTHFALAENNISITPVDTNITIKVQTDKHVKEQLKREETFAKTQSFAQGDDYNLTEHQVDPKDLDTVPVLEPEYDLNMDDAYD